MFINFQNNNKSYYNSDEIYLIEYIYKEKPQAYDIVYIGQGQISNYINNWSQSSDVSGIKLSGIDWAQILDTQILNVGYMYQSGVVPNNYY